MTREYGSKSLGPVNTDFASGPRRLSVRVCSWEVTFVPRALGPAAVPTRVEASVRAPAREQLPP